MGTINYKRSDYITIGFDLGRLEKILNLHEKKGLLEDDHDRERVRDYHLQRSYEEVETLLNNYDFYCFHVIIEPGYYEGFYINIENNFPLFYDNYHEKKAAQKEITQLKDFLLNCLTFDCRACSPGWCTTYFNSKTSKLLINEAIKNMRQDVHDTPTFKTYEASERAWWEVSH